MLGNCEDHSQKKYFVSLLYAVFILCISIAIGIRPDFVGSDTPVYILDYYRIAAHQVHYEFLFTQLVRVIAFCGGTPRVFLTVLALINNALIFLLVVKLANYLESKIIFYKLLLLISFFLLISPFFFSCQTNVLRQGMAIFLLILAYLSFVDKSYSYCFFVSLLALGFHKSTIFFLPLIILTRCRALTLMRIVFILCTSYLLEANQYVLHHISPGFYKKISEYGLNDAYFRGVRYDFVTFTIVIGLLFNFLTNYVLAEDDSKQMNSLLKIYWILTIPFFLFGFGSYSDRYLLPAWVYISIISAVFTALSINEYNYPARYYVLFFILSFIYFISKASGYL